MYYPIHILGHFSPTCPQKSGRAVSLRKIRFLQIFSLLLTSEQVRWQYFADFWLCPFSQIFCTCNSWIFLVTKHRQHRINCVRNSLYCFFSYANKFLHFFFKWLQLKELAKHCVVARGSVSWSWSSRPRTCCWAWWPSSPSSASSWPPPPSSYS